MIFIEALLKKLYNNLISIVLKANGKIGKISLQFGENENIRYMTAIDKIKVSLLFLLSSKETSLSKFLKV